MTRREAKETIYEVINSGIIDKDLEERLTEVCNCICDNSFDKCKIDERCKHGYPNYCEGCDYQDEQSVKECYGEE